MKWVGLLVGWVLDDPLKLENRAVVLFLGRNPAYKQRLQKQKAGFVDAFFVGELDQGKLKVLMLFCRGLVKENLAWRRAKAC